MNKTDTYINLTLQINKNTSNFLFKHIDIILIKIKNIKQNIQSEEKLSEHIYVLELSINSIILSKDY